MKKSQGESFFEVAKPTATTATPLPSPREGTKSVTTKEETTLVSSEETNHFGPVPSAPLAPARRSKAPRGGVWVFISRSQGLNWPVSTIRARAGRCREGGLSSTDERVSGHVTEVSPVHDYNDLSMISVAPN